MIFLKNLNRIAIMTNFPSRVLDPKIECGSGSTTLFVIMQDTGTFLPTLGGEHEPPYLGLPWKGIR